VHESEDRQLAGSAPFGHRAHGVGRALGEGIEIGARQTGRPQRLAQHAARVEPDGHPLPHRPPAEIRHDALLTRNAAPQRGTP
jgi:hypothetical protein